MERKFLDLYEDYDAGLMDRREFLAKMAVFMGSTAAASSLLMAFENDYACAEIISEDDPRSFKRRIHAMAEYKEATLYKMEEMQSTCPPKHVNTDAFTLIPEETGAKGFALFCTEVHPGGEAEPDVHPGREHCYFMLSGTGRATVNGKEFTVRPGHCLWIPPGAEHSIKPVGGETIRFAVVTSPAPWVVV